jgi:TRAP-type C4-dicarboxylate transport system permease small subunit
MATDGFEKKLGLLSTVLSYVGATVLFALMSLTAVDVACRYLFNAPILGVFEITEFMVLIVIFSFLASSQSHKTHVAVDLVIDLFPKKVQRWIDLFNHVICLILMGLITWRGVVRALELKEVGEASPNLQIPDYPFVFFLVLGCLALCFEYLRDLIGLTTGKRKDTHA